MIRALQDFTYDAYVRLLISLKKKCKILPFCEVSEATTPYLILRHDVDASLEAALRMANMEHDLGVRSTYFVLFSYKFYNLLERGDFTILKEISRLGHEIGLHYDVLTYESYGRNMKDTLEHEIKMLERLVDTRVTSIARHNVSLTTREDPFKDVRNYVNAYNPELCEIFVSDSCRAWFLNDLSRFLDGHWKRGQLLIHPFLWTEDACERCCVLEKLFQTFEEKNKEYKLMWLRAWHTQPKVKEYDRSIKKNKRT